MTGSSSHRTPGGPGRPASWESWPASGRGPASAGGASGRRGQGSSGESAGPDRPADSTPGPVAEDSPEVLSGPAVDDTAIDVEVIEPEPDPLVEVTLQRDEYRDALIRLQADFENYKKRILKQQTEHLERAAEGLVEKLLPVLDAADLALAHGGGDDVKQISTTLVATLEREGLERIDPGGGPFDPTLHDAVAHEPSDDGEQEVVEVLRAGYRWKGRVLRPAMVKVRG
jgi:molecular chaperone GrpE